MDMNTFDSPLRSLLGVDVPIVQAPMAGGWTTPELAAAVSNAGALGMLAAARTTVEQLQFLIQATRERTNRPFGVNFLLAPPEPAPTDYAPFHAVMDRVRTELSLPPSSHDPTVPASLLKSQIEVVLQEKVPIVSFAMGRPGALVRYLQRAGVCVLGTATTVEEALLLAEEGVDVVVAQGADAGGHRSTFDATGVVPLIGTMALTPQMVDAVDIPVIASGGIGDGRGVVAALALGASGVQIGTRFLVAVESGAFRQYRDRILGATEADTVTTRCFSGRMARGLRNRLTDLLDDPDTPQLPWPYQALALEDVYRHAMERGDADWVPLLAGQGLRLVRKEESAATIIAEIVRGARHTLQRLSVG